MAETVGARERGRITPDEGAVLAAETARNAEFGKPVLIYPNLYLVRVPFPTTRCTPSTPISFWTTTAPPPSWTWASTIRIASRP
ncbi:MAG: hypothetical protein ACLSDQ_12375 [Adlercreutzia equolifaciens]